MADKQKLTAAQRAAIWAQATRQSKVMSPVVMTNTDNTSIQFALPKTGFLSKIALEVKGSIKLTGTEGDKILNDYDIYKIIRDVSLNFNNGFKPFRIDGRSLAFYNSLRLNSDILKATEDGKYLCKGKKFTSSTAGTENTFSFLLEMPLTLNESNPTGIYLLQNNETNVVVTIDVNNVNNVFSSVTMTGVTPMITKLEVSPMIETFSIPSIPEGFPDISVLKLVSSSNEAIVGSGEHVVKLPVGTIYRKLILYFENEDGTPMEQSKLTSNIGLYFNQTDNPYNISPSMFRLQNISDYGTAMPDGCYIFDFSKQNIPNTNSTRDFIDTEKMTEFWVKFNTSASGKITYIPENLARLTA